MNIGAAVAAADTGEGSDRVSVAVTVTDERWEENFKSLTNLSKFIIQSKMY